MLSRSVIKLDLISFKAIVPTKKIPTKMSLYLICKRFQSRDLVPGSPLSKYVLFPERLTACSETEPEERQIFLQLTHACSTMFNLDMATVSPA
jgi:hypothetical protein